MKSKSAKSPLKNSIRSEASASATFQRHALQAAVSLIGLSVGAAHAQAMNSGPAVNTSPDKATTSSNQLKGSSAQNKLKSDQHKLTSTQMKVTSTQMKLKSDQQKFTSTQSKLTSDQQKLTNAPGGVTYDLRKNVPTPAQ